MKKVLVVVAAVITMAVMPICADAHVVRCSDGHTYMIQTVPSQYFDTPEEYDAFCAELAEIVCKDHGSTPVGN